MFILDFTCGGLQFNIPNMVADVTSTVYFAVKVFIPIILIFFGMLDMGKAVIQQKEDEIKKSEMLFVKRIIAAILVFLVASIVQIVFGFLGSKSDDGDITGCIDCFLSGSESDGCTPANTTTPKSK